MQLVNTKTNQPIKTGEVVHDFRGQAAVVTGWELPRSAASTGRVYVKEMRENGFEMGYYPSVYNLKWMEL